MAERCSSRPVSVPGPTGKLLRIEDLPAPDTRRWVARRKAEVVAAVAAGLLSLEEACRRYNLSAEEFASWQRAIDRHGLGGLRVTRLQAYGDRSPTGEPGH
jgi:transposase-like protein